MTTPDFQTQLRIQLRDAARREERRGVLAPRPGWWRGLSPALAAAAVALIAVAVVLAGLALRGTTPDRTAKPQKVERLPVAGSLGPVITAFGSVWAVDPNGRLIRLDPRTEQVAGSLDVPGRTTLGAAGGSLWVNDEHNLIRIDPKSGDVQARIPLRTPHGDQFVPDSWVVAGDKVWFLGVDGLLRIDLRRSVADRFVPVDTAGVSRGGLVHGDTLWVLARNDRLLRLDARTGARLGSLRVTWPPDAGLAQDSGVDLTWRGFQGRLARVDVESGRELWARNMGGSINWWTATGPDVWVHISSGRGRDHLVRLDARTGRVVASVELPDFGVTSMTVASGRVWVGTPNGTIDVVRIAPR
jgi:outer membrane protein assembly factor BamB